MWILDIPIKGYASHVILLAHYSVIEKNFTKNIYERKTRDDWDIKRTK